MSGSEKSNSQLYNILFIALLLSISIVVGIFIYIKEKSVEVTEKATDIEAISILKVNQISEWYKDEIFDAVTISGNTTLIQKSLFALNNICEDECNGFREYLYELKTQHSYVDVLLLSPGNTLICSALNDSSLIPTLETDLKKEFKTKQYYSTGIYKAHNNQLYIDIICPLKSGNATIANIVFRLDAGKFIASHFSFIASYSNSYHSFLLQNNYGKYKLLYDYSNEGSLAGSRFKTLELESIVTNSKPITKNVSEGTDYMDEKVLYYMAPIPNTPWLLLSKVDKDELFGNFNRQAILIVLLLSMLLLVAFSVFSFYYSKRESNLYRSLYHSQQEFKTTLYSINDGVIITDQYGFIKNFNKDAENLTGYKEYEIVNKNLSTIINLKDYNSDKVVKDIIHNCIELLDNKKLNNRFILISTSGEETPISCSASPIKDDNDLLIGIVFIIKNQTEERKHELELMESRKKYYTMFEMNPQPMWIYDLETLNFLEVNEAAINHYGYSRQEFLSMTIKDIRPAEDVDALLKDVETTVNRYNNAGVWRHLRKNGELIYVNVQSHVVEFNKRMARHVLAIDITDIKLAQDALLAAKKKAEESDHLKTAFLANMSHEIRTPMNGIIGFMELLQQPDLPEDQFDEYIEIVKKSGERLLNTINDIIDISKIESGQSTLNISIVDINQMLLDQYEFFKPQAEARSVSFSLTSLLSDDTRLIKSDEFKLQSVIVNLIKNAIKFTKAGRIDFGVELVGKNLIFKVKDTGKGIPQEKISKIFDRFVQADTHISRDYEGSGLGLAISKAYVDMFNGEISVESVVGEGSTFKVSIPYIGTSTNQSDLNTLLSGNYYNTNTKILVTEDDEVSYIYISRLLNQLKINHIRACNGAEAVELCQNVSDFSHILMDLKMPVMDGYQAVALIKEIRPELPVIALTAYAFSDEREKALSAGCIDYLSKPVRKDTLLESISKFSISNG